VTASAARLASIDPPHGSEASGSTGIVLHDTYTLGPRIGQGGMGEVYEAAHVRLPGRFAVKVLRPDLLTNQDATARFCREAEIMSALRHPHIIQIFDFNTSSEGLPYFVMEFLDGADLEMRLADTGALPLAAVVRIVDAVASALGAAHALGIVHRDLKPANIFLIRGEGQDDDFVKVIDFGISKTAGPGPRLSKASEVMGTPEFMAPEQALGLVGKIDARTDQFALAAITYLMLTGREPFVGEDPASLLYQVVHEQPSPLSRFLSWDTTEIQMVLDRALSKRQEARFDSIVEFASALAAAADSESAIRRPEAPAVVAVPPPAALLTPARIRAVRLAPRAPSPVMRGEDDWRPPVKRPRTRPPTARPVETRLDRVPHGPQRALVLGLAVLGLTAGIVHQGWYRGFPQRAVKLEQNLVGLAQREWKAFPPSVSASTPEPTQGVAALLDPLPLPPSESSPPSEVRPTSEVPPSSIEPASGAITAEAVGSGAVALVDDPKMPPRAEEAPRRADASVRPARHHSRRGFSRAGWQITDLPFRALAPSELGSSTPPTAAPSLAPPPLTAPSGFSIPQPAPSPPGRDLAPAPASIE
jgi:eukaryotic-like serine/threonine-protein kinase